MDRSIRRYTIGEMGVEVTAPLSVLRVLDETMARVPVRSEGGCAVRVQIDAHSDRCEILRTWEGPIVLGARTPAPVLAGAATTAIAEEVARRSASVLLEAVVVEKEGRGLALVGTDWRSCVTIAAHLSLRDWRMVTPRHAFVDPKTLRLAPFPKLLYLTAQSIPHLPRQYRRALEASPWFSIRDELAFYGVDPCEAVGSLAWGGSASLSGALLVEGSRRDAAPAIEARDASDLARFVPLGAERMREIRFGSLDVGPMMPTADLVERWIESYLASPAES